MSPARKAASPKRPRKPRLDALHVESPQWSQVDDRLKEKIAGRRPKSSERERALAIADRLAQEFPEAHCALHFTTPFQLLIATILSAQCTDARVNMVTPGLFAKYTTPRAFAQAPPGELEKDIHSTGFFNSKARAIREAARMVDEEFDGEMPSTMEDLLRLRGTARKTANVVRMHAFGMPGISVDTHFSRITQRLRLTKATDPENIEFDIAALLPPERWTHFADSVILHGRKTCDARKPKCEECRLAELCPSAGKVKPATGKTPRPSPKRTRKAP